MRSFSTRDEHARAHTHTHNFTHKKANGRQWEAVAILSPAPIQDQGAGRLLKTTRRSQPKCPCLAPSQEEEPDLQHLGDTEQFLHTQTAQHRKPAFHVGRKTAVGPLTPAGHIAGQKNWEGAGGKLNDPGLTILFHSTTGTQQVCWTDTRTMALALSCMKEIRSVVVVLGRSQFPPVGSGRVWWTVQFDSLKNKAAAGFWPKEKDENRTNPKQEKESGRLLLLLLCCYLSLHSAPSFMAGWVDGSLFLINFILHWNFIGCSTNSRHLLNVWVSSRADRRPLGTWCWTQPGYSFWLSIYFTVRCLQLHVIPASKEISKDAMLLTKVW